MIEGVGASNEQLLAPQNYLRIYERTNHIRESSELFGQYVMDNQLEYSKYATRTRQDCDLFEQSLVRTGFSFAGRTEDIAGLVRIFQEIAVTIQKMSTINMIGLKQLLRGEPALAHNQQFKKTLDGFLRELGQYSDHNKQTDKLRNSYRQKCQKLTQALSKCDRLSQPTTFYNPEMCQEVVREAEERYKSAMNKELLLVKEEESAGLRRRRLQECVRELKNQVIVIVKFHIGRICEMINIVLDSSHWEKEHCIEIGRAADLALHYSKEMERFNALYRLDGSRAYLSTNRSRINNGHLNLPSDRNVPIGEVHADNRMFLERCEAFIASKNNELAQSATLKRQLCHFLQMKLEFMRQLRTGLEEVNQRWFGAGQKEVFRQRLVDFFGTTLAEAFEIVETIISAPTEIIARIERVILERFSVISQLIHDEEQLAANFQREAVSILAEQRKIRTEVFSLAVVPSETHQQFTSNIKVTFLTLRANFNSTNERSLQLNRLLGEEIKQISTTIERECFRRFIKLKMEREQGTYDAFRRINVNNEVLRIVDQDPTYRVLFHEFYTIEVPQQPHLRSEIDARRYQEVRQLLEQKEVVIMNDRNRPFITSGCLRSTMIKNYPGTTVYKCCLYENGQLSKGKLVTLLEGIHWISKPKSFFGKKCKLVVPRSDIRSFELKDIESIKDCVVVHTKMGELTFTGFQNRDETYMLLTKLFPLNGKDADTDSRSSLVVSEPKVLDRSLILNTSKIMIRKGTSQPMLPETQVKQVPQLVLHGSDTQSDLLARVMERWYNTHNFFPSVFVLAETHREGNWVKSLYRASFCGVLTHIRQFKEALLTDNSLAFNFTWKISFPNAPSLKPFMVTQNVRVFVEEPIMKVYAITRKPSERDTYLYDIFYEQLKFMDTALAEFVTQLTDRECELQQETEQILTSHPSRTNIRQEQPTLRKKDFSVISYDGPLRRSEINNPSVLGSSVRPSYRSAMRPPQQIAESSILASAVRGSAIAPVIGSPQAKPKEWQPSASQLNNSAVVNNSILNISIAQVNQAAPQLNKVASSEELLPTEIPQNKEGSPQEVFMILTAYLLLFLVLFVL